MEPLRLAAPEVRCAPSSKLSNVCKLAVHCRRKINSARVVAERSNHYHPISKRLGRLSKSKGAKLSMTTNSLSIPPPSVEMHK